MIDGGRALDLGAVDSNLFPLPVWDLQRWNAWVFWPWYAVQKRVHLEYSEILLGGSIEKRWFGGSR